LNFTVVTVKGMGVVTISACGAGGDPTEAFGAAQQSVRDGDFQTFCDHLTPNAVDDLHGKDDCAAEAADRYDGKGHEVNFVWDGAKVTDEKIDGDHATLAISNESRLYTRVELRLVDGKWLIDNANEFIRPRPPKAMARASRTTAHLAVLATERTAGCGGAWN
jgi:hypothetical protein